MPRGGCVEGKAAAIVLAMPTEAAVKMRLKRMVTAVFFEDA